MEEFAVKARVDHGLWDVSLSVLDVQWRPVAGWTCRAEDIAALVDAHLTALFDEGVGT